MRQTPGSEIYGTTIMTATEVEIMMESCLDLGLTPEQTVADVELLDTLMHLQRLHRVCGKLSQRTRSGYFRRDSTFAASMSDVLNGFISSSNQ